MPDTDGKKLSISSQVYSKAEKNGNNQLSKINPNYIRVIEILNILSHLWKQKSLKSGLIIWVIINIAILHGQ